MAKKRARSEAEELAALCAESRSTLTRAGRALHDDVGPQLAGAGILLSLVRSDFPKAALEVQEALSALDQAMERVRALSQELNPSPVDRLGLRNALLRLAEEDPRVEVTYSATAKPPREVASVLYETAAAAIRAAANAGAERIQVGVTGGAGLRLRVADDGRAAGRTRALAVTTKLAEAAGLAVTISTIKSTIVSISYAVRSSVGR